MSASTATTTTRSAFEETRSLVLSAAAIFADYDEALRSARLSAESRLALLGLQALGVSLPAPVSRRGMPKRLLRRVLPLLRPEGGDLRQ
jgi:hypothetical protein